MSGTPTPPGLPANGRSEPRFVPIRWLPSWIVAIALPPLGIIIRRDRDSARLRRHERVHWWQYQQRGLLGYYLGYVWEWARAGFSYERHPWEIEARRLTDRG